MLCTATTTPGGPDRPNEDWYAASPELVVVCDGATTRTATGCWHGAAWYARTLGTMLTYHVDRFVKLPLSYSLMVAIDQVAGRHESTCDLSHPGTPSAAVGVVHVTEGTLRYLVLGDVTVVLDTLDGVKVVCDQRISASAATERAEVDRYLIGSDEKTAALIPMKRAELAARNQEYWIAAADSSAADHALTGEIPLDQVRDFAVLTDGAARYVDLFNLATWSQVIRLLRHGGPGQLIELVRGVESHDPLGERYARNKAHDDATAVFAQVQRDLGPELVSDEERMALIDEALILANDPSLMGERLRS